MIELKDFHQAIADVIGRQEEWQQGWDLIDIQDRFELLNISIEDFQTFLHQRLEGLAESELDVDLAWSKGFTHAAIEFFLYGLLIGKEKALDSEIDI